MSCSSYNFVKCQVLLISTRRSNNKHPLDIPKRRLFKNLTVHAHREDAMCLKSCHMHKQHIKINLAYVAKPSAGTRPYSFVSLHCVRLAFFKSSFFFARSKPF
ncbi:hypothetical protein LENED_000625 [Lentinula edodes]|uniref:Uncharacterized protein n=1 Tax=Lentinula edodes TaxID=5353 RepID=A0A1Q3DW06_LENED|nr:hypothetical protein LENED_000625 [Lentinula edodes]